MTHITLRDGEGQEVVRAYHDSYAGYDPHLCINFNYDLGDERHALIVEAEWLIRILTCLQVEHPIETDLNHYPPIPAGTRGIRAPYGQRESEVNGLKWIPTEEKPLVIGPAREIQFSRENVLALMQWIIDFKSWDQDEIHHLEVRDYVRKDKLRESRERLVRYFNL